MSDLGIEQLIQIAFQPCPSCCSHEEFPGLPALTGSAPDCSSFLDGKEAAKGDGLHGLHMLQGGVEICAPNS